MALIGNYSVLTKDPGRSFGGSTISDSRANFNKPSPARNLHFQDHQPTANYIQLAAIPNGYVPPYCWRIAQETGGMATYVTIQGIATQTGNLAGGLNAVAPVTGSGNISNANGSMLIAAIAALSGAGITNANISALIGGLANLTGAGNISSANLAGLVSGVSALVASGDITNANMQSILSAAANLAGSGNISNANMVGGIAAVAALVGSGTLAAPIVGIFNMATGLTGSGDLTAALKALANAVGALTGAGTTSASASAPGTLSADIIVTGSVLNTANVASAVWDAVATGSFTYHEIMKVLAAVAAGKTTIVPLGSGTATVTFRDLDDTKDVVDATMNGSERVTVIINKT